MKVLIQRVAWARVRVESREIASIPHGLLLYVAVEHGDDEARAGDAAARIAAVRVFADEAGKMNRDVLEVGGQALVVSQFTLAGSLRKGRRPSFDGAAPPDLARRLVDAFAACLASRGVATSQGVFAAHMEVESCNDGPVTFLLDVS
jgi:D-tyrosyl-tRNA(Tyr) deacylase